MSVLAAFPAVKLRLGGSLLEDQALDALDLLRVQQKLSQPAQAELVCCNPPDALLEAALAGTGQALEIHVGEQAAALFQGEVTAVEVKYASDQTCYLHLRAYDRLYLLDRRNPVRAHIELTLDDLAAELTSDLDLEIDSSAGSFTRQTTVQHFQSDLQMLRQIAEKEGMYFQLFGNRRLRFFTLEGLDDIFVLQLGRELISAEFEVNNAGMCRSVATKAWDPWLMETREGDSSEARSGRDTKLQAKPGGEDADLLLTNRIAQTDEQAEALAQGVLDRHAATEVVAMGVAEGLPGLQPGVRVELRGTHDKTDGRFVLASVVHVIDRHQGYICEFDSMPPAPLSVDKTGAATTFGIVSRVQDPEGLARIRVVLPAFDDFESDWLDVVMPAAGAGKGLMALPDIDDRVLVLLAEGDPAQGIVLGGVYGSQQPPDPGVEGEKIERYSFLTPGGQHIRMDDGASSIRLETTDGQYVEMDPDTVQMGDANGNLLEMSDRRYLIHATARLEIEAPGEKVFIRGKSIDFERAE